VRGVVRGRFSCNTNEVSLTRGQLVGAPTLTLAKGLGLLHSADARVGGADCVSVRVGGGGGRGCKGPPAKGHVGSAGERSFGKGGDLGVRQVRS
jgi:hypothetical protein